MISSNVSSNQGVYHLLWRVCHSNNSIVLILFWIMNLKHIKRSSVDSASSRPFFETLAECITPVAPSGPLPPCLVYILTDFRKVQVPGFCTYSSGLVEELSSWFFVQRVVFVPFLSLSWEWRTYQHSILNIYFQLSQYRPLLHWKHVD